MCHRNGQDRPKKDGILNIYKLHLQTKAIF